MLFSHSPQLIDQFPQLAVTALSVTGITAAPDVADTTRPFLERATARLVQRPESEFAALARSTAKTRPAGCSPLKASSRTHLMHAEK